MQQPFDPITLEILWSRRVAVADEVATTSLRTASSPIIRESNDCAACLMNADGETMAECSGDIPTFAGLLGRTAHACLRHSPGPRPTAPSTTPGPTRFIRSSACRTRTAGETSARIGRSQSSPLEDR